MRIQAFVGVPSATASESPKLVVYALRTSWMGNPDGREVTLSSLLLKAPTEAATETPSPLASQKTYSSFSMSIASRCERIRLSFSIRRIDLSSFSKAKSGYVTLTSIWRRFRRLRRGSRLAPGGLRGQRRRLRSYRWIQRHGACAGRD